MALRHGVPVGYGLLYDATPTLGFWSKLARRVKNRMSGVGSSKQSTIPMSLFAASVPVAPSDSLPGIGDLAEVGAYVPFKQCRLTGQVNPLRPPPQVETVLIGQALHQRTGYLYGVGFRVCDDGQVEAEFTDGVRPFKTYEQFKAEVLKETSELSSPKRDVETTETMRPV